ncbi:hypothetical protein ACS0TY_017653 [Phlomoides rotata]
MINMNNKRTELKSVKINENWCDGVNHVKEGIYQYFKKFFSDERRWKLDMRGVQCSRLAGWENQFLTREFCIEEIKQSIWSCDDNKSPGPNGYNMKFIKRFWNLMEEEVLRFFVEFHTHGKLAKGINSCFMVLIPKVRNPLAIREYRPISLVGCLSLGETVYVGRRSGEGK